MDTPPRRPARRCPRAPAADIAAADNRRAELHADVALQNRLLKSQDILANAANRRQEIGIGGLMGGGQLVCRHAKRLGREAGLVDPAE